MIHRGVYFDLATNITAEEKLLRQFSDGFLGGAGLADNLLEEACNAEFSQLFEDKITAEWAEITGIIEDWEYGTLYRCCKPGAAVRPSEIPPYFPEESCLLG